MITRAVLTVLGVLGLCLLLVAQEPNPGEHGNGQTITQQDLLGTGEIDVVPALALYQPDSFSRSGLTLKKFEGLLLANCLKSFIK